MVDTVPPAARVVAAEISERLISSSNACRVSEKLIDQPHQHRHQERDPGEREDELSTKCQGEAHPELTLYPTPRTVLITVDGAPAASSLRRR